VATVDRFLFDMVDSSGLICWNRLAGGHFAHHFQTGMSAVCRKALGATPQFQGFP
jgi:hypothetical protein